MGQAPPKFVRKAGNGEWRLEVWVQPGAKKNELAGLHDDRLKIRLSAPAVDNKANQALVLYVAGLLGLKRNQVSLTAGHTSRKKTLRILAEKEPIWPIVPIADEAGGEPPTEGATHGSIGSRPHRKVCS